MSETSGHNGPGDPLPFADPDSAGQPPERPARSRRKLRIVIVSVASCVVFLGAVAVGIYLYVNHLASGVHRVPVTIPKVPGASPPAGAMTVLVTSADQPGSAGLIMLLHLDAHDQKGGVVSIVPQTLVQVPGHGVRQIGTVAALGGASLLVSTVEQLTHVQIDHYARVNFTTVGNLVNVIGGVNVTLAAKTVSGGHTFNAGVNHLTGVTAAYYVRSAPAADVSREVNQQNLLRAILDRISSENLLTNPVTADRVVHAVTGMLTVDSNFTNSEVEGLAIRLNRLSGSGGTFVTAPTYTASGQVYLNSSQANQLWAAIRTDSIAAFAATYPATLTPSASG